MHTTARRRRSRPAHTTRRIRQCSPTCGDAQCCLGNAAPSWLLRPQPGAAAPDGKDEHAEHSYAGADIIAGSSAHDHPADQQRKADNLRNLPGFHDAFLRSYAPERMRRLMTSMSLTTSSSNMLRQVAKRPSE